MHCGIAAIAYRVGVTVAEKLTLLAGRCVSAQNIRSGAWQARARDGID